MPPTLTDIVIVRFGQKVIYSSQNVTVEIKQYQLITVIEHRRGDKKKPYNPEKLATFRTQDTERRQKQTNKTPNKIQVMEMKSRVCFIVVSVIFLDK